MKEIEDIILEKEYFELSVAEKAAMSDLVSNEEEFAEMKWFLHQSQKAAKESMIAPSANLKASVFAELNKPANKRIWLNGGAGAGAVTTKKKIYQMPAFQIGIAACVVVGFLLFANPFGKDQNLALNDTSKEEVVTKDKEELQPEFVDESGAEGVAEMPTEEIAEDAAIDGLKSLKQEEVMLEENAEGKGDYFRKDAPGYSSEGEGGAFNQKPITGTNYESRSEAFAPALDMKDVSSEDANYWNTGTTRDKKDKDKTGIAEEESLTLDDEIDATADSYLYKEAEESVNSPGQPVTATGVTVTTLTTESADADISEKSTFANVGNTLSKKKNEEASKVADVPVLNAVSIAETSELKSLFFTVP